MFNFIMLFLAFVICESFFLFINSFTNVKKVPHIRCCLCVFLEREKKSPIYLEILKQTHMKIHVNIFIEAKNIKKYIYKKAMIC